MPEFKIQCQYYGKREKKFFHDKKKEIYHKFCVINADDLPNEYFRSLWRGDTFNQRDCWLLISDQISKKIAINWEKNKDYCFVMNLGGSQTAAFNVKDFSSFNSENSNAMVLKSKEYFENTIKKIGSWDNENYFYELEKNSEKPSKNKSDWGKIFLVCLPIIIVTLPLFFVIKRISKNK